MSKSKSCLWVVSIDTFCDGHHHFEEWFFKSKKAAQAKMHVLIKKDKKSGVLARYIKDIGTKFEKSWEISNFVESVDSYRIDGHYGDYVAAFRVYLKEDSL
jgi:hypothetical protein